MRLAPAPLSPRLVQAAAGAAVLAVGAAVAQAHGVPPGRVLVLLLLAPLLEEVIFRAGLQEALLRHGARRWVSNVLTAACFGLAHAAWRGDAAGLLVALPALLVGAWYARDRRLMPCVGLHAAMNAVWLGWNLS